MALKARFDLAALHAKIDAIRKSVKGGAMKGIEDAGYDIGETAVAFAPRKSGALELAITVGEPEQGRDEKGRFGLATVSVYVDGSVVNSKGRAVDKYASIMHEELEPHGDGDYFIGAGSEAKDGGSGDVGGRFLERALEEHVTKIEAKVGYEVKKVLQ